MYEVRYVKEFVSGPLKGLCYADTVTFRTHAMATKFIAVSLSPGHIYRPCAGGSHYRAIHLSLHVVEEDAHS